MIADFDQAAGAPVNLGGLMCPECGQVQPIFNPYGISLGHEVGIVKFIECFHCAVGSPIAEWKAANSSTSNS